MKWLPWRFVLSRLARSKGFIDPITLMSRLQRFAQPSEVAVPLELVRAGAVFHARGFINTRAIQHNLDWVWPYWVEEQFNPASRSFIPRAFSITHVNLTHRNWTAVGLPGVEAMPIVDPRGLLTPTFDGWSLDAWVVPERGEQLLPSRAREADQRLSWGDNLEVRTAVERGGLRLRTRAAAGWDERGLACEWEVRAAADRPAWLVVSLRPANPEGVAFIHDIAWDAGRRAWTVNDDGRVEFDAPPERVAMSDYNRSDVHARLDDPAAVADAVTDDVGLATAAAMFRLTPGETRRVGVRVPLEAQRNTTTATGAGPSWPAALARTAALEIPDERMRFLYDAAVRTLVLLSPSDVYPGPYTYKRFWFRDAAFMIHAMLAVGLADRAEAILRRFPQRQRATGYFLSQEGEWDANGEAIWILHRFTRLTGRPLGETLLRSVRSAARWIERKRLSDKLDAPHAGLLPAGFSAEHLGPNDYYYWDDFWGVEGLRRAAELMRDLDDRAAAAEFAREADAFAAAIDRSLERTAGNRDRPGIPASPHRRMDAGAIGSIVAGYPLGLWGPRDERLLDTVEFLLDNCTVHGGFFQDMIHSGVNAYLTLHLAQVLLRAGDDRFFGLVRVVADLASPTGQWPEAIHPLTLGGCMGDGQHGWAAAEWALMMRSCFVREEGDALVLASGVPAEWLEAGRPMRFGPTPTPYGDVEVEVTPTAEGVDVRWHGVWRAAPPSVEVRVPGHAPVTAAADTGRVELRPVAV